MISKNDLLESMAHEIRVIQHLATKIPERGLDYRPTPGQRSMLDLLRYLSTCAIVPATAAVKGNWDHAEAMESAGDKLDPADFAAAMDRQAQALKALISEVPEQDLQTKEAALPWGAPVKLGRALVDMALKPLTAYRMQFFLYLKSAGRTDLGPAQCWVGVDP